MEEEVKNNAESPQKWVKLYAQVFVDYLGFCKDIDWSSDDIDRDNLQDEYSTQKEIAVNVLSRLKYFVSNFDGYLDRKYAKDFISLSRSIVDLYLERSDSYIKKSSWKNFSGKTRNDMLGFQSVVMKDYNGVQDKYLTITDMEGTSKVVLPIHSDKKIPLVMADLVEERFSEVRDLMSKTVNIRAAMGNERAKEAISSGGIITHTAYEVLSSTELFVNMKNPPKYNPSLHYFEQTTDVIQFYKEELYKMIHGVYIGGVFFHPWLYTHLNYFKTDIPMSFFKDTPKYNPSKTRIITNPTLRDNELYMIDAYAEADKTDKGMFVFGTRRFAKTVLEASLLYWKTVTVEMSESLVICMDDGDLAKLSKTLEVAFANAHPAFLLPRNQNDWKKHIQFGVKDKANVRLPFGDIFIKNVNTKNNKGAGEKTAGATPTAWILDEGGKGDCISPYVAAQPSFQTPDGQALVPLIVGTGGEKALSQAAREMLLNPNQYNLLVMDWDRLEDYVPEKSLITWKRRKFGIFVPGQMSFRAKKIRTNLGDYLGIPEEEALKKIDLRVTDWKAAKEQMEANRSILTGDKLSKEKIYYPFDPMESFLNKIENPFCAGEAQIHLDTLKTRGDVGRNVDFFQSMDRVLSFSDSLKDLAEIPFPGGNIDAPGLLFIEPTPGQEFDGTFVAGLDHYKHDKSSTDSVGSLYVFKRNVDATEEADTIAFSYNARPDKMDTFNRNVEIILEAYGAECLQENADISFQLYLRQKNKEHLMLANGDEMARRVIGATNAQNNKYGLVPSKKNKQYLLNLVIDYCNEYLETGLTEEGISLRVRGVTRIKDPYLLEEIINFNYEGNFDRITAFGHALAWARYLDSMHVMPRKKSSEPKKKRPKPGMYGNRVIGTY